MARPTTIKLGEGEVILKNLPKEKVEEIKALLTGKQPLFTDSTYNQQLTHVEPEALVVTTAQPVAQPLMGELPDMALGLKKDSLGNWLLVEVKYNSDTLQASVDKVTDHGKNRDIALGEFRVMAARKLF